MRRARNAIVASSVGLLLGLGSFGPVEAQVNEELFGAIQLNLTTPGARSLGLGGAFVGLADDATAAYANPAGLLWLENLEVAVEGRTASFTAKAVAGGNAGGVPSGIGIDTNPDLVVERYRSDVEHLSFASVAFPGRKIGSDRWVASLSWHQLAAFRGRIDPTEGGFLDLERADGSIRRFRVAPLAASMSLDVEELGASLAVELRPSLWVGATLLYRQLDLQGRSARYSVLQVNDQGQFVSDFGPADTSDENVVDWHDQSGHDDAFGLAAGALYRQGPWTVGLVYRSGSSLEFDYRFRHGDAGLALVTTLGGDPTVPTTALSGRTELDLPDTWAAGASRRFGDRFVVSAEIDYVTYSAFEPNANIQVAGIDTFTGEQRPGFLEGFRVDDTFEAHLGIEYVRWGERGLALRVGTWFEQDHRTRYAGTDPRVAVRYPDRDDVFHGAAGFGLVLGRGGLSLDAAVDYSEVATVTALSFVWSR